MQRPGINMFGLKTSPCQIIQSSWYHRGSLGYKSEFRWNAIPKYAKYKNDGQNNASGQLGLTEINM